MPGSYAIILDPSVGTLAPTLRTAFQKQFANADFIDIVLPADKHEAVVVVRAGFEYEIYRNGESKQKGRSRDTEALVNDVAKALRR